MHYTIISRVLRLMGARRPQENFLIELLMSWLTVQGRFNFTNVARYCCYNEGTLRLGLAAPLIGQSLIAV